MAVAGCTTIDPTLMPVPVSPAQAETAPHPAPGSQGPADFLAAFGQAMDATAQVEQQPALPAQTGARPAILAQVPGALAAVTLQTPAAAVPVAAPAPAVPHQEALATVPETTEQEQPAARTQPAILVQVAEALPVISEQRLAVAAPDPGPAPDAPQDEAFPTVPETADDCPQPRALARRATSEPDRDRPAGAGQAPPAQLSTPYACACATLQSAIPDPEPPSAPPGQAQAAQTNPASPFFRSSKLAPELTDFADATQEAGRPVRAEIVTGAAECSPARGRAILRGQDPETSGEAPVELPAAETSEPATDAAADAGSETARSVQVPRCLPESPPSAEARSDSGLPPLQLSPEVGTASEIPLARTYIPSLTASTGPKETVGLKGALEFMARVSIPPLPPSLPHLPPSPDRLPADMTSGEIRADLFRPVLLIETAPHPLASAHRAAQPVEAEAAGQAGSPPLTPSARPDQASDVFTRTGAGSLQAPAPDPACQTPICAPSGRGPGLYFLVPELTKPSCGGSSFADASAGGNAGGAAQHFFLQGRPAEAPAVTQPSSSLMFTNAEDLYLRLAEQMQLQVREGKSSLRIQLKPDALGRLEIRAESTAAGLTATIVAETHGVKAFLEQNLHSLYRTLQDMGLKVDRILVTEDGSQHHAPGQPNDGEARPGQDRSYPASEPSWLPEDPDPRTEQPPAASAMPGYWTPHSTFHAVA